jgi:hypothetical protein
MKRKTNKKNQRCSNNNNRLLAEFMAIPTGIQQYNAFLPVRVDRAPSCATI